MNESNAPIDFHWHGPFRLSELLRSKEKRAEFDTPGVYLWTEYRDEEEVISYVGKASGQPSLWARQTEHYLRMIGGGYKIPAERRSTNTDWEIDFSNPEVLDVLFDLTNYQDLVKDAFQHAAAVNIFLCKLEKTPVNDAERNLLYDLQPVDTSWGTKSEPSRPLSIVHKNAEWATEPIRKQIREHVVFG